MAEDYEEPIEETTEPVEETKKPEKDIVDRVLKLKKQYEQATQDSRKEFAEIFSVYMGKTDEVQKTPYNTTDDIPKLRTEVAYVVPSIFSGEPEVELLPVGDEDVALSKIYEKMVNHRFRTIKNFNAKIEAWVKQSVVFPASEIRVLWKFATEKKKGVRQVPGEVDPTTGEPAMVDEEYEYEEPVMDGPDVEVPNHMDVYFNPIISEVADQPCIIFRSVLPIDQVKEDPMYDYVNENGVRNADIVEESGKATDTNNSSTLGTTDIPNAQQDAMSGMVEVFELVDDDRIQTVANGKLLRDTENPYGFINCVKLIHEPNAIPNRYEGHCMGTNTLSLGKMFYKMFNQISTNVKLCNNPMSIGKKGSVPNKQQLVSKPGGHVEIKGDGPITDNFQWLQFPDIKQGAIELLAKIDDEHKRASGANDLVQGAASNDTLGQDELAQTNVSIRFELIVRRFKDALAKVAEMMLKMELQNLQSPEAEILRIFPQEMREQIYQVLIDEKDTVKFNVRIKGETNVARNKDQASKRKVELFNLSQNFLTDKEKRAFLRDIAEEQGMKNIDSLIGETNPIMEQQEQMQLAQGQMGMPQEGMVGGQAPQQGMVSTGL